MSNQRLGLAKRLYKRGFLAAFGTRVYFRSPIRHLR